MKSSNTKKRSQTCYSRKVANITKWYKNLVKNRELETINPNTKQAPKLSVLKSLDFYIEKIKKPTGA